MEKIELAGAMKAEVVSGLGVSPLFGNLNKRNLDQVAERAELLQFAADELLMSEGDASDSFFLVLAGEVAVETASPAGDPVELGRIGEYEAVGEMGLILDRPRSATVRARSKTLALKFSGDVFDKMYDRIPEFGRSISAALASRLESASRQVPLPEHEPEALTSELVSMLPIEFIERQRVLPVAREGDRLTLGFVDDPSPSVLSTVRRLVPGMQLRSVRIRRAVFDGLLRTLVGIEEWRPDAAEKAPPRESPEDGRETAHFPHDNASPRLDRLLRRMIAEGASDVHLSPARRPRWRIDGEIYEIEDSGVLDEDEVLRLLEPVMPRRNREEFARDNDTDFAHALADVARFRVNLFREAHGVGAVLRQIPMKIMSLEQLALPPVIEKLCDLPKGLVLVTGPTGSGKSTTLAAMIDHINRTRRTHIITLEDPIEFMHESHLALVNQREVGAHTNSFARALRASLREDPDIVLVGEMRDLETIALALETAQTGHLVFATLHTSTAMGTVDRIIDQFPADQQAQVRSSLSEVLRGVVAQTLCRRVGGGRVAAFEILVATPAVANLVREGKTYQLLSIMQTGKTLGMRLLNEQLAELVFAESIEADEALARSVDKQDLMKRLGVDYPIL